MAKFKNIEVNPEILASIQTAGVFTAADVVFPFTEIELPIEGACRVISISILNRDHAAAKAADFAGELHFSKSDTFALGTPNSTANMKPNNDLFATTTFGTADFDAGIDLVSIATVDPDALNGLILEPKAGSRSVYVSMISKTSNEPDLRSLLTVDGAHEVGDVSLTVADVDATNVLAPGDVLHAADNAVIGTVASIASATSVLLERPGVAEALEDDDVIHILSPIRLIIGVEYA
tara:strand:+ start:171 stop:875 length:705 start_codon:yes stop_codon:yes gene_type:complete